MSGRSRGRDDGHDITDRAGRETAPRVPRTIDGIADALTGARRMEFSRAVGQAEPSPAVADALVDRRLPADQFAPTC